MRSTQPPSQMPVDQATLIRHFSDKFGSACQATPVCGGDINTCFLLRCDQQEYFVKSNKVANSAAMFQTESTSLRVLGARAAIKVPVPISQGCIDGIHYLVLEALNLTESGDWQAMGRQLAHLHRQYSDCYGWEEDNFIGRTPQHNRKHIAWDQFWWECRLLPQLTLACNQGYRDSLGPLMELLQEATGRLLGNHQPPASVLHGDLWGGNAGFEWSGEPVIFDPASYYGDRETDLAMTQLFGGFPSSFYTAYMAAWPLPDGHNERSQLYNLYHLLNHLNLFGDGYLSRCLSVIRKLSTTA